MKEAMIPIDKAGRVVLPKEVRDELAIHPGDLLKISVQGNQVTLRPSREKAGFVRRGRALVFSTGGNDLISNEEVEAIRNIERDTLTGSISKGLETKRK